MQLTVAFLCQYIWLATVKEGTQSFVAACQVCSQNRTLVNPWMVHFKLCLTLGHPLSDITLDFIEVDSICQFSLKASLQLLISFGMMTCLSLCKRYVEADTANSFFFFLQGSGDPPIVQHNLKQTSHVDRLNCTLPVYEVWWSQAALCSAELVNSAKVFSFLYVLLYLSVWNKSPSLDLTMRNWSPK